MVNLIIISDLGFFVNIDGNIPHWSNEYPDAFLFTSKKQVKSIFKANPVTMHHFNAEIVKDYGLESEMVLTY